MLPYLLPHTQNNTHRTSNFETLSKAALGELYLESVSKFGSCFFVCVAVDVVALTGCARTALGICASSSGAVAGLLSWQVYIHVLFRVNSDHCMCACVYMYMYKVL